MVRASLRVRKAGADRGNCCIAALGGEVLDRGRLVGLVKLHGRGGGYRQVAAQVADHAGLSSPDLRRA
jgi:hypothetical protein